MRLPDDEIAAIASGEHGNPFAVLGRHKAEGNRTIVRAFVPGAERVDVVDAEGAPLGTLALRHPVGVFEGVLTRQYDLGRYVLDASNAGGRWRVEDAYGFAPVLGAMDDWLIVEGTHERLYDKLGAHAIVHEGVGGVHFAVWAPNARRVSVVGDFNEWDGRRHVMRRRVDTGVWETFVPGLGEGAVYKYEIVGDDGTLLPLKADPVGFGAEMRPGTASVVRRTDDFVWGDDAWMSARASREPRAQPMAIYEVHLGSWRRADGWRFQSYDEIADSLVPYVVDMGFTHVELLPVNEHPLDDSWGYQPIGLFAPTSRFGEPAGFARLVDRLHQAGVGVILDWVPAHFPTDVHGLSRFDGTALYEHADPRLGFHPDWNTAIYNFGRIEVANTLYANALFWLDRYHVDALRVDAVASMLYLDYSRKHGEWLPNKFGGRENLAAIDFLRRLNELVYGRFPGAFTIAEESTAWPGVSRPVYLGGLGFGFKWNMGWMHDTLGYMKHEPIHRRWHHNEMTFALMYAYAENFVLPLSHDEVVHGKGSLYGKMAGDDWQKRATLRAYYGAMWGFPGKKLLFMGQEFAQVREWNFATELDWWLLDDERHRGIQNVVRDLNRMLAAEPALYRLDSEPGGFSWVVVNDSEQSVFAWMRFGGDGARPVLVVSNFTPVPRSAYRVGLPFAGRWVEILNTDATHYGGTGWGNLGSVAAREEGAYGWPASAELTLPPLSTVWFAPENG
jgi:1,4-alpha-glucan branching enzyme